MIRQRACARDMQRDKGLSHDKGEHQQQQQHLVTVYVCYYRIYALKMMPGLISTRPPAT